MNFVFQLIFWIFSMDYLKRVTQKGPSYIKDDYINKVKSIDIPVAALLVAADVVELYTSIAHEEGLKALRNALENRNHKEIPDGNLIKMTEFVLKQNYFEFGSSVSQQSLVTAIETKFNPPYACIFIDQHET